MKNIFVFTLILSFLIISCQSKDEYKTNAYQIINLIIQEFGKPLVPPATDQNGNLLYNQNQLDSIKSSNQKVRVYPLVKNKNRETTLENRDEFKNLFQDLRNSEELLSFQINKDDLEYPNNYKLKLLDTVAYKKDRQYLEKNRFVMVSVDNMIFNDDYTKAIVIAGAARSQLAGFSSLILFEKKNGKWIIKDTKTLTIS